MTLRMFAKVSTFSRHFIETLRGERRGSIERRFEPQPMEIRMTFPTLNTGVEPQPLIAVRDVRMSSGWYAELLGADSLPEHSHRDTYDRILVAGRLILQLHAWDEEDHPNLVNAAAAPPGHGVVLWFQVDDFDAAVGRARALKAEVVEEPHVNDGPGHREMWLRDADGYVVVIASPDGDIGS